MEVWGDGSNVRLNGASYDEIMAQETFLGHHFGVVRHAARLRQKSRFIHKIFTSNLRSFNPPSFLFDLFPYDWFDKDFLDDLAIYEGPYIRAVRENPQEFVRDRFKLYNYLIKKSRG